MLTGVNAPYALTLTSDLAFDNSTESHKPIILETLSQVFEDQQPLVIPMAL
ncbi:6818_t:CDS:2 [Entrophospora sp. SA101]|nr:6818_t:CDS:2 [Entrophospora sp. SA101]